PAGTVSTVSLWVSLSVAVVALGLFVWRQLVLQRIDDALLDLRVFRSGNFTLSIVHMLVMSTAFFGTITLLPLFMQSVLGVSALETGLVVLPGALVMGLAGPVIGRIYDRWGTRVLLIPGTALTSAMLWFYTTYDESTTILTIAIAQTVLSLGLAMSFTPLFTASLASLDRPFYSYGSAVLATTQQVGGAAGIALLVTIFSGVSASEVAAGAAETAAGVSGTRAAFLLAAIVSVPLLISAVLIRKPDESGADLPAGFH
ncbi:MFS transporter, partial [Microbacterium thalassium]|uniref:MFS transporter n=1 Tax=Microbacterium thalassium TaxID=362649 RepID=UPI0022F2710B